MESNVFATLAAIDVSGKVEKKNGLSYVSWAWAWYFAKRAFPEASFKVYENADGLNYHTDGRTCWVKTGVTIEGIELIEYLPVMDNRNQSIPLARVTSFDVNKSIQRSLTKALARHGLGLCVYAGEDLPLESDNAQRDAVNAEIEKAYKPVPEDKYIKYVAGEAQGLKTPGGRPYRTAWIGLTHAGEAEIAEFDQAVIDYKINNNL